MCGRPLDGDVPISSFRHLSDDDTVLPREVEEIGGACLAACRVAYRSMGGGLRERIYRDALSIVLEEAGHEVRSEVPVFIEFRGHRLGEGYRADLVVDDTVVLEVKSVPDLHPTFQTQLLTYLRAGNYPLGFVANFGGPQLRGNIKRRVNSAALSSSVASSRS